MTRQRLTAAGGSREIIAEIEKLEKLIHADMDQELVSDAQALADEEVDIVEDSAEEPISEDVQQNERAMDNWPATASEREDFARRLVAMAKKLMA